MDNNWKLQKIELELESFGEQAGTYKGKIQFKNDDWEQFSFKISPDMAQPFIDIIAEKVVIAASELGEKLLESLGLEDK